MNVLRNVFTGLITALASTVLVIGALSLALTEGYSFALPTLAPITQEASATFPPGATPAPVRLSPTAQPVLVTPTPLAATACPAPQGWNPYIVQTGDTLRSLAARFQVSAADLKAANCLITQTLLPGTILYLPAMPPTATATLIPTWTPVPCGPPAGWVRYLIQPGDNLHRLSLLLGVSIPQLMNANCLTSTQILAGSYLWVPFLPPPPPPTFALPTLTWTVIPPVETTPVVITIVPSETVSPTSETPTTDPSASPTTPVAPTDGTPVGVTPGGTVTTPEAIGTPAPLGTPGGQVVP